MQLKSDTEFNEVVSLEVGLTLAADYSERRFTTFCTVQADFKSSILPKKRKIQSLLFVSLLSFQATNGSYKNFRSLPNLISASAARVFSHWL